MLNGGKTTLDGFKKLDKDQALDLIDYLSDFAYYETIDVNDMTYIMVHAGMNHFDVNKTLDEYIKSLEVIYGDKSHSAMKKFVLELRKNIEIYGDDSIAVHKMRETYKSAMLVNFFNLAIQSLRGVDNKDKLLAFRMELSQKKLDAMTVKANKMVEKGQKAVMLIFLILAQFIVLSWIAKAGLSFGML